MDINKPELLIPVCETKQKRVECLCCNSGEIEFTVSLPRKGFYAGRHFPLTIQTENNSSRRAFMMVEIKKVVLLRGDGLMTDKVKTTAMYLESRQSDRAVCCWVCFWLHVHKAVLHALRDKCHTLYQKLNHQNSYRGWKRNPWIRTASSLISYWHSIDKT